MKSILKNEILWRMTLVFTFCLVRAPVFKFEKQYDSIIIYKFNFNPSRTLNLFYFVIVKTPPIKFCLHISRYFQIFLLLWFWEKVLKRAIMWKKIGLNCSLAFLIMHVSILDAMQMTTICFDFLVLVQDSVRSTQSLVSIVFIISILHS